MDVALIAFGLGVGILVGSRDRRRPRSSNPWLRLAATAFFTGVVAETFRAVVGSTDFQPGAALLFGVVLAFFLWLFERSETRRGQGVQHQPE